MSLPGKVGSYKQTLRLHLFLFVNAKLAFKEKRDIIDAYITFFEDKRMLHKFYIVFSNSCNRLVIVLVFNGFYDNEQEKVYFG